MDTITQICELLLQKNAKFAEYEQATLELLHCDVDDVENYITKRGLLANKVDEIDKEMQQICEGEAEGTLYYKTACGKVNFNEIGPDLHPVFERGQQLRAAVARIQGSEPQVLQRLETLKNEALSKIRENQNLPKIKRYLSDLGEAPTEGNFTSGKA